MVEIRQFPGNPMKTLNWFLLVMLFALLSFGLAACSMSPSKARDVQVFNADWKFHLGDVANAQDPSFYDAQWRTLNLPHDWSIEGPFKKDNPATAGGGALPGGTGWYRKSFTVPVSDTGRIVTIEFDGVYRNSEVWINGHYLGLRPYGYSSFQYELSPFLKFGDQKNVIAVKVDNSKQPNSRWYSGSGIYRNVRLVTTNKIHVAHWGTFVTTPEVTEKSARVMVTTKIANASGVEQPISIATIVIDEKGTRVGEGTLESIASKKSGCEIVQEFLIATPTLWSIESPRLYKTVTTIAIGGKECDTYATAFGIRTFAFDREKGFTLNGKSMKIKGVCNHHDLGCLGSAVNLRAIERQLQIMKAMGVNGIRTSHNPPAPELLDLCDRMGFIVLDEAFDMWKTKKTEFDYALSWDEWHRRDLEDMVLRDRNHPSVFMWSIGNEVNEQWPENAALGAPIALELAATVRGLDSTRPVTSACNNPDPKNPLFTSGALDLTGLNYHHDEWSQYLTKHPGKPFLGTETTSSLNTRGHYDMPSDSIRRWPLRWDIPFKDGNPDLTCSSYDNCSTPWGTTHEETWKIIKKYDFLSSMFIWTGFDYLGEPTPYDWPARSSYFGIVDLAGFPKDMYYMYQSEWTDKPMLHVVPHWNWEAGKNVDVWVYSNCEEVELLLNGKSLGTKRKTGNELHLMWKVAFAPGTLKAVGRTGGKEILTSEVATAGPAAKIVLEPDRSAINADGLDLSFVTVKVVDANGVVVPDANTMVTFSLAGNAKIAGVDNGLQTSNEPFQANYRKAFNGLCLAVVQSTTTKGKITLTASSPGLSSTSAVITAE
jgi:beta-galactosidase